jgi:ABC-2 type transport system ATP-binding protein
MIPELVDPFANRPLKVATRGLAKTFGRGRSRTRALAGLDLAVPEGAVYVLVGPNGAGKTTALAALMDLTRPDAGTATVDGLAAAAAGPRVRGRIGFVPEHIDFGYPRWPVARLLAFHARYFPSWDPAFAARLGERLELPAAARYDRLSKGQARRVQLVLALAHRPPLLLLDEPTDGLDPLVRDQVTELLADYLAETGATVLLSTHRVHEVEGLADHLGVLSAGRLVAQLERSTLAARLHRVRAEVPAGWAGAPDLDPAVIRRAATGREISWVVWGEPRALAERLGAAGATVRAFDPLNLEDASLALLSMEAR